MTYLVAWKFGGRAYLCADTVITTDNPSHDDIDTARSTSSTSFQEQNVVAAGQTVAEGAIKIVAFPKIAVGFSGSVRVARSILGSVSDGLKSGLSEQDSFMQAIRSNGPYGGDREVGIIGCISHTGGARLLAFNDSGNGKVTEIFENEVVTLGSVPAQHELLMGKLLEGAAIHHPKSENVLATALATLQSYGIHTPLLQQYGIGGPFVGIWADELELHWQGDTIYVQHGKLPENFEDMKFVSSIVRGNGLAVNSTATNSDRYFLDIFSTGTPAEWLRKWKDEVSNYLQHGKFDFLVFMSTHSPVVTLVELGRQRETPYVHIRPVPDAGGPGTLGIELSLSPEIAVALNSNASNDILLKDEFFNEHDLHLKFNWFPLPPDAAE